MNLLPHLAARVFNTPLLIARTKLDVILAVLGTRVGLPDSLVSVPAPTPRPTSSDTGPPGIAVIPIHGTLVRRTGGMDALSGLTSYETVESDLDAALADPRVRGILLDVDSPGGEAAGVFDLADRIAAARNNKPIWALINGEGFSAAYALASAASRVVLTRTAGAGSIGVIALHVDQSVKDAADGYRYSAIYAGERKNDFSPHEPLSGDARNTIQTEVNRLHDLFVDTVSRHRGLEPEAVRGTQAQLFFGDDAVKAGLADAVGSYTDALAALSRLTAPVLSLQPPKEKSKMTAETSPETGTPSLTTADVAAAATRARAEAETIADLCLLARHPERTAGYLAQGLDANAVRKALLAEKAEGAEIVTRIAPNPATSAASLEDNPVMKAAQARAANARKEK